MEKERVIKIAVIGPESTGKTQLCEQLAIHYKTTFVPEYARTYFETHDISNYSINDLEVIYAKQLDLEKEKLIEANKILFSDTNLISGMVWSQKLFDQLPSVISEKFSQLNYDLHLVCDIDLPWVADDQRKNEFDREELLNAHYVILKQHQFNYTVINGKNEQRLQNAIAAIEQFIGTNNLNPY